MPRQVSENTAKWDNGRPTVRLATIVRLRWIAVLGQLLTVGTVYLILGFPMPVAYCLATIALSAWLNVFLAIRFPARHRTSAELAALLLAYDILQLMLLLHLTGGIDNPFTILIVAPVVVSAATLPLRYTLGLGFIAMVATLLLVYEYWPLPWIPGLRFQLPFLYKMGVIAAVFCSMVFLALYAWRLANESRQMSDALSVTELVIAREQKLHALDGLAAAAAHELGTPLSTIYLVSKELERDLGEDSPHIEDVRLLRTQADRCREILRTLTRKPTEQDPMHARLSVREMIDEAAAPYIERPVKVEITSGPTPGTDEQSLREPVGERKPGVIYGLGNIVENAVDYARSRVEVGASWDDTTVTVRIADDGPGFPPDLMDALGEPYVTTRSASDPKRESRAGGLGLGFFIAKTLLERSGANVNLENREEPETGAIVTISWPRSAFTKTEDTSWWQSASSLS